jgi:hypothetical protein
MDDPILSLGQPQSRTTVTATLLVAVRPPASPIERPALRKVAVVFLALFGPFALKVTSAGPELDQVYVRLGSPPSFGRGWFPDEKFVLLGDGGHASYEFAGFLSTEQCSALRAQEGVSWVRKRRVTSVHRWPPLRRGRTGFRPLPVAPTGCTKHLELARVGGPPPGAIALGRRTRHTRPILLKGLVRMGHSEPTHSGG